MDRFQQEIHDALDDERAVGSDDFARMIVESFHGRHRRLTWFAMLKMSGAMLIAVLGVVQFFGAESVRAQIGWAAAAVVGTLGAMQWWLFYWIQVNRDREAREIKRLELQVAELRSSVDGPARPGA